MPPVQLITRSCRSLRSCSIRVTGRFEALSARFAFADEIGNLPGNTLVLIINKAANEIETSIHNSPAANDMPVILISMGFCAVHSTGRFHSKTFCFRQSGH